MVLSVSCVALLWDCTCPRSKWYTWSVCTWANCSGTLSHFSCVCFFYIQLELNYILSYIVCVTNLWYFQHEKNSDLGYICVGKLHKAQFQYQCKVFAYYNCEIDISCFWNAFVGQNIQTWGSEHLCFSDHEFLGLVFHRSLPADSFPWTFSRHALVLPPFGFDCNFFGLGVK